MDVMLSVSPMSSQRGAIAVTEYCLLDWKRCALSPDNCNSAQALVLILFSSQLCCETHSVHQEGVLPYLLQAVCVAIFLMR